MMRMNELVITPIILICMMLLETMDFLSVVSSCLGTYRAWSEWIEFCDLRFQMQQMYLRTMETGGPQIVTNNPLYLPYVYADAVVRQERLHRDSGVVPLPGQPWMRTQ